MQPKIKTVGLAINLKQHWLFYLMLKYDSLNILSSSYSKHSLVSSLLWHLILFTCVWICHYTSSIQVTSGQTSHKKPTVKSLHRSHLYLMDFSLSSIWLITHILLMLTTAIPGTLQFIKDRTHCNRLSAFHR